jgi:hypothetical protein
MVETMRPPRGRIAMRPYSYPSIYMELIRAVTQQDTRQCHHENLGVQTY